MAAISTLLLFLLAIGAPIVVAVGLVSFYGLQNLNLPAVAAIQSIFASLDSFTLMAVPFYILAGNIMQAGGISSRLVSFATAILAPVRGGLGSATVLSSLIFASINGSSAATAASVGSTTIKPLSERNYPKPFAASIVASSSELGSIIPPSLQMIVFGLVTNVSVGSLFLAGILPGISIAVSLVIVVLVWCAIKKYDDPVRQSFAEWFSGIVASFRKAILPMLLPVIVLGGIFSGTFTPTEASVVAVFYAAFISCAVYRELSPSSLLEVLGKSALTSGGILAIVAVASAFSFVLTLNQIPQLVGRWIMALSSDPLVFLLIVNLVLLLVGMFLETLAAIVILAPILTPVAISLGIHPVHFGMVMITNLAIGMLTPPIGVNLFIVSEIAGLKTQQLIRPLAVFLLVLLFNLALISYFPALSLAFVNN